MELYYISLHAVDQTMRRQFGAPETHDHPNRHNSAVALPSRTTRMRLMLSASLYRLANALDPTFVAPRGASHQP